MPAVLVQSAGVRRRCRRRPPSRSRRRTTVLMLSLEIATGVASADGTSVFGLGSLTVPVARASAAGRVTLDQRDRQLRGRLRLEVGVLVDGHALVASRIVLQALDAGVLTGDRDLAREAVGLEPGDDAAGHGVVGGDDAVDLAVVLGVDLLEDVAGLGGVPLTALVTDELVVTRVDLRLERLVVALLEQRGVVVGRGAVDVDDVGLGLAGRRRGTSAGPRPSARRPPRCRTTRSRTRRHPGSGGRSRCS